MTTIHGRTMVGDMQTNDNDTWTDNPCHHIYSGEQPDSPPSLLF
jgi:hypothetical protein